MEIKNIDIETTFLLNSCSCASARRLSLRFFFFVVPLVLVLFRSKTFVIVTLEFEQLLEVWLAKNLALQSSVVAQRYHFVALATAKASLMENFAVCFQFFHRENRFVANVAFGCYCCFKTRFASR
eukprot:m.131037 g.131037  ORF g.131037 m.131037 type:complete len:125 (-) comp23715_c0_seq12:1257-1631(-)